MKKVLRFTDDTHDVHIRQPEPKQENNEIGRHNFEPLKINGLDL